MNDKDFFARKVRMENLARGDGGPRVPFQVVKCDRCGARAEFRCYPSPLSPDAIVKKLHQKKWRVGSDIACADCLKKEKAARPVFERKAIMAESKPVAPEAKPARSLSASEKLPELYLLLDEVYDRVAKNYKNGNSDNTVAATTGLSPEFVKQRREMDFGPLEPPKPTPIKVAELTIKTALEKAEAGEKLLKDALEKHMALVTDLQIAFAEIREAAK